MRFHRSQAVDRNSASNSGVAACLHAPFANSQQETPQANSVVELDRELIAHGSYILGPGDGLEIELVDVPELSGRFTIGPDGTITSRLRPLCRGPYRGRASSIPDQTVPHICYRPTGIH